MPRDTMADKETNQKKGAGEKAPEQKVVTRYEKRLQRRAQEEAERKKKHNMTAGIAAAVVLVCVGVAGYKAYDTWQENHGPYMSVGSHKISQAEFDYQYNSAINSFYSQYGSFASYFGLDLSRPLDQQYYSDTMTWKDYFEKQAATQLQQVYALTDEAKAQGFEYDAAEDVDSLVESLQSAADSAEMSVEEYCVQAYGEGISLEDVKRYAEMNAVANAYYESIKDAVEIEQADVESYYNEHKNDYDSVDYMLCKIEADIPEPEIEAAETEMETEAAETEAAETEAAETEAAETETEVETEAETEDNSAEIQAAMDEAKGKAEAMKGAAKDAEAFKTAAQKYASDPEAEVAFTGAAYNSVTSTDVADWLFDEARAAGDIEVIEDTDANTYYVALFQDRYLEHIATADVRHILIQPEEVADEAAEAADVEAETAAETEADPEAEAAAQAAKEEAEAAAKADAKAEAERIYKEWQSGEATEDSFAALAKEYSEDTGSASDGGLYMYVKPGDMVAEFNDWLFDEARKEGDTDIVETSYGYHIMYYLGADKETWYAEIQDILIDEQMSDYMDGLLEKVPVSDPRGHLSYLAAEAAETEAATETAAESEKASETETAAASETEKK